MSNTVRVGSAHNFIDEMSKPVRLVLQNHIGTVSNQIRYDLQHHIDMLLVYSPKIVEYYIEQSEMIT